MKIKMFFALLLLIAGISAFSATGEVVEKVPEKITPPTKEDIANAMLLGTILAR